MTAAGLGYACAAVVAVIFATAAVAKALDQQATTASFHALGLPWPAPAARLVPVVEIVIAVVLVLWPPLGALAALVSLTFFTTFLVTRLRAGVQAPCSCFGTLSASPLSAANLVGNGFLLAAALVALAAPAPTRPTPVDVAVVVVGLAAEVGVHALVRHRVTRRRTADHPAPAP